MRCADGDWLDSGSGTASQRQLFKPWELRLGCRVRMKKRNALEVLEGSYRIGPEKRAFR
jgi:hypothetical protein